ncbi:hypothetical protein Enr10x_54190 [Gimesia panareensis]|uniref:YcxB-like protein domain-containing protein n=1 Tax=Gimesia panareensis TaxID=2527978 RepID=A0A517QEI6_9PLAN|nr:hypothetical protein [Gimesia panareensis]QDT30059.1 hypothetical protein Enr10x_54190 [Gimesia panareensis]
MQLPPYFPVCRLNLPDGPHQALSSTQSLILAEFIVNGLISLYWIVSNFFVIVIFVLLYLFSGDHSRIVSSDLSPVLLISLLILAGISTLLRCNRSRLMSKCLNLIQRLLQHAPGEIKVSLTREHLILNATGIQDPVDIEQTYKWQQVESITENETGFHLQLPCLPELRLPKEQLPPEWLEALENFQEQLTDES